MKNKLFITIGDPAGIGPVVTVGALAQLELDKLDVTVVGDVRVLENIEGFASVASKIKIVDLKNTENLPLGCPSKISGKASLEYLEKALELIKDNFGSSLVTAPVSKEAVAMVKPGFCGHTEFLAEATVGVDNVVMVMVGAKMKVALLTRHIPLGAVAAALNYEMVKRSFEVIKRSFDNNIKIAVCSVNPHAGIDTYLGEEEKILEKVIKEEKNFYGPYPSDTIFKDHDKYDLIIAAYHDQAMIPFKLLEFSDGVNLTLGLPFTRTSPAHGTAYNLVNKPELIDSGSMLAAIKLAQRGE